MKKQKKFPRRLFLRGLYNTSLALPVFDLLLNSNGEAYAQGASLPKFYYSVYAGLSLASGGSQARPALQPSQYGSLVNLPFELSPLVDNGLTDSVQIISNLTIPRGNVLGGVSGVHGYGHSVALSGWREKEVDSKSFDSPDVLFSKSSGLNVSPETISVQASRYNGGITKISYEGGKAKDPELNLFRAYNNISSGIQSADPEIEKRRLFELKKRGTILDLVKADLGTLKKKLGQEDKQKLDRHISSFRDLESKLVSFAAEGSTSGFCNKPNVPPAHYVNNNLLDVDKWRNETNQVIPADQNYSKEKERAVIAADIAYMALSCQTTNAVNIIGTFNHPWLNSGPITGVYTDFHNLSHGSGGAGSGDQGIRKAHQWHLSIFSQLMKKLKDTSMGSKTMFDQSVGVYFAEAGRGRDYGPNFSNGGNRYPHTGENMLMMVAGNRGGLKPGRHVNGNGQHPTKVFISALNALGVNVNSQGEVSGRVDELF